MVSCVAGFCPFENCKLTELAAGLTSAEEILIEFTGGLGDIRAMLEHSFKNLTEDERETLMQVAVSRSYQTGDAIFNQGDQVDNLMVVAKGMLRVTHVFDGRLSEFVGPLGPGDVVGEMSFADGKPASATLIADGDTEVLTISRDAVESMIEADPAFAGRLYKDLLLHLAHRLRTTNLRADPGPAKV